MLQKDEKQKLEAIQHQRTLCHDILVSHAEGKALVSLEFEQWLRQTQTSVCLVSKSELENLERIALQIFVAENKKVTSY